MTDEVPNYQYFMTPVLKVLSNRNPYRVADLLRVVADAEKLTPEQRQAKLPSGHNLVYNRVHWAQFYLRKAGLLERPERGIVRITDLGLAALESGTQINTKYLERFPRLPGIQEQDGRG